MTTTDRHIYRGGYTVEFPLSSFGDKTVVYRKVEIHQEIRMHDTAVIRVRARRLDWFNTLGTGAPVKITYWGVDRVRDTFVGYVTKVHPVGITKAGYERDIICVAASREFRTTDRKTYRNKTAPEIVQDIGKKLGFKVITKQHGLRRPVVVHGGETHWEFLAKLAKRVGYVLRAEETTLFFLPLKDMVKMHESRAPYLTDSGEFGLDGWSIPNVISVEAWSGDVSDDPHDLSDAARIVSVSPATGMVTTVTELPGSATVKNRTSRSKYIRYPTGTVAHSRTDAKLLAKGAADNGMMAFDAVLHTGGQSGIKPYRPVSLAVRDRQISGTWIVKKAVHTLTKGTYEIDMTVSSDSLDGKNRVPARAKKIRDLATEAMQGFSPDVNAQSRLRASGTGFVKGKTGSEGTTGKWVSS